MIKDLIYDIAYDKINLSQALSRSKLLAYKIDNDNFKEWLRKELEGYDYTDKLMPAYRRIQLPIVFYAYLTKWPTIF
jgi:AbiTii-like protein